MSRRLVSAWVVACVFASGSALAGSADVRSAGNEDKAGAQGTFSAGSKLFDAKHFDEAMAAFRASYQIVASPNSRLMIARCLRELGREVDAYREYDAVAAEARQKGDRYEDAARAASEERDEVKKKLAFVTVRIVGAPPSAVVKLGDARLEAGSLGTPLPIMPGRVVVGAEADGYVPAREELSLGAGETREVQLTLAPVASQPTAAAPPPPPPPVVAVTASGVPLRTWAYVAGGVGAAGLVTFGVFGAMTNSKYGDLQTSCPSGHCAPSAQADIDAGKRSQTIANVGLVVGVLGLGTGATLFVLSGKRAERTSAFSGGASVTVGAGNVTVGGRF